MPKFSPEEFYSPDYATARGRFLAAAERVGAAVRSHRFAATGPGGEPLTMDVARLGDARAGRVVIVSSGLHGVEGFFGSAVQLAWLLSQGADWRPPPRTALVMAHALNPFGFAWRRRCNENNVDLNRNFLDEGSFVAADPEYQKSLAAYDRFAPLWNPASPPSRWEPFRVKAMLQLVSAGYAARRRALEKGESTPARLALKAILDLGLLEFQRSLPVGQYEHPTGLFFGGAEPEETVRTVREALPAWAAGADEVVHVDLHTGLGKYADCRLLVPDEKYSQRERWASATFGNDAVEAWDARTAYAARGLMANDLGRRLPACRYHCVTAEFGTYSGIRVLGALRAENRAHFFDRPGSASYRWAKRRITDAFCPAAPHWRAATLQRGLSIIDRALAARRGE